MAEEYTGRLPPRAVEILKAATKVGEPNSLERAKAVNHAINLVKGMYPEKFKRHF